MYKILGTLIAFIFFCESINAQTDLVLDQNTTPQYNELIEAYRQLDQKYDKAKLFSYGNTDFGLPVKLFVISDNNEFNAQKLKHEMHTKVIIGTTMWKFQK